MTASFVDNSTPLELADYLRERASAHPCAGHRLFDCLRTRTLNKSQLLALLRNYDAHASVLRRLLLKAAAIMPEPAVPFVLENVRNEYGNGNYADNHQDQLRDLAWSLGITRAEFFAAKIQDGVRHFIREATRFYGAEDLPSGMKAAAVAAGAVTATELLAVQEFACMQTAFACHGLQHHIWFQHVSIELEHSDESLALALHFSAERSGVKSLEYGLDGILNANLSLYDGLLAAISEFA